MNTKETRQWAALRRALYIRVTELKKGPSDNNWVYALDSDGNVVAGFDSHFVSAALRDAAWREADRLDVAGLNAALRKVVVERLKRSFGDTRA